MAAVPEHRPIAMTSENPTPSSHGSKPQRVLACILCQQRKVKCDRKFPCANCVKARAQCVPATLTQRRRRRRFPERDLLDRLRRYEDLLRHNNISFEPLHRDSVKEIGTFNAESGDESQDENLEHRGPESSAVSSTTKPGNDFKAKNIWHAMSKGFRDPDNDSDSSDDNVRETAIRKAWDLTIESDDQLLFGFGSHATNFDLTALHPGPVQIFRLWQIHLDNINPLLKVIHTPSLQGRIIEAASNLTSIAPTLEALMFGIYCTSLASIATEDCQTMFGSSKEDLLKRFQFGCQQALWKSGFLRTTDRDCLTALYFYLLSIRTSILPQSLSSILGAAVRVAQRMGIHNEATLVKCDTLEAEMRRRLWWSLALFDARVGEMAGWRTLTLDPTWDCKIPLNVSDSDLRPEMKKPPAEQGKVTEALFVVVRSELADFVRHTSFHLDFTNPALKPVARYLRPITGTEESELDKLEESVENRYLKFCDPENPIHFMTIWTTRAQIAKYRLLEHHSRFASPSTHQTEAERDAATTHALRLLECDTKIMTAVNAKDFIWLHYLYFPFPAFHQIVQDLRKRPLNERTQLAWETMSDSYQAWFELRFRDTDSPVFQMFSKMILQGWDDCEAALTVSGRSLPIPGMVSSIRAALAESAQRAQESDAAQLNRFIGMDLDDFSIPMPRAMQDPGQEALYTMGLPEDQMAVRPEMYHQISGQDPMDPRMYQQWAGNTMGGWPCFEPNLEPVGPCQNALIPTVRNGTYEGRYLPGFDQDLFLGIPYAQDTAGQNRFRISRSLNDSWTGTCQAIDYGPACSGLFPEIDSIYGMSENCLSINIVRSTGFDLTQKLPVMFWIYGGSYQIGTSGLPSHNLSHIVERSAEIGRPILGVSINYKKTAWGNLYSNEVQGSGDANLALRGMRRALAWVSENIASFGGDPDSVTTWGQSSGAFAVGQLLMTYGGPTDGLFHRSIQESGSATSTWFNGTDWYQPVYDDIVLKSNCSNTADILDCLRTFLHDDLFQIAKTYSLINGGPGWYPTIDGDILPIFPTKALDTGKFATDIPCLCGVNTDEGTNATPMGFGYPESTIHKILEYCPDDLSKGIPANTGSDRFKDQGQQYNRIATILGDIFYVAPNQNDARSYVNFAKQLSKTYVYRFNTRGWVSDVNSTGSFTPPYKGVAHTAEISFVFNNPDYLGPWLGYQELSDLMSDMWINFAHNGDPNAKNVHDTFTMDRNAGFNNQMLQNSTSISQSLENVNDTGMARLYWPAYDEDSQGLSLVLQTQGQGGPYIETDTFRSLGRGYLSQWAKRRRV